MRFRIIRLFVLVLLTVITACATNRPVAKTERYEGGEVRFHFDSAHSIKNDNGILNAVVEFLHRHPDSVVILEGRTDAIGSKDYNLDLGDRRARSVKGCLMAKGVAPERIVTVSYGEEGGTGLSARFQRRVVIRDGAM